MIGMEDCEIVTLAPRLGQLGTASDATKALIEKHGPQFRINTEMKIPALVVSSIRTNWLGYIPAGEVWMQPVPGSFAIDVNGLHPATAQIGAAALQMKVIGSNLTDSMKIVWNGAEEPTTFISPSEIQTGVDPTTATGAYSVPVWVESSDGRFKSIPLFFSFVV